MKKRLIDLGNYLEIFKIEHFANPITTPSYNGKTELHNKEVCHAVQKAGQTLAIDEVISIIGCSFNSAVITAKIAISIIIKLTSMFRLIF